MKATVRAVLSCVAVFNMLYKVVLTFESVDEILKCDHSNESNQALILNRYRRPTFALILGIITLDLLQDIC